MHSLHIPLCPTTSTFLHHPTVTTGTRCIMRVKDVAVFMAAYPTTMNPIALFLPPLFTFHTLTPHILEFSSCNVMVEFMTLAALVINFSLHNHNTLSHFTRAEGSFLRLPSYQLVMLELLHQLTHTGSYCRRALYLAMRNPFLHPLSTRATASLSSAHRWVKTAWCCPPSWSLPVSYWHTQLDRLLTPNQWSISTFIPQMQPHKCKCLLALLVSHPCTRHNHRTCLQLGSLTKMLLSLLFSKHRDKRSHAYLHWKPHYAIHPW